MSITKGQFRWLVTALVVVTILCVVVSFVGESSLPAPLRDYLATQWEAAWTARDIVIVAVGVPLIAGLVVSFIGLYCFWPFTRPLTLVVLAVGLILQMLIGPTVDSGLATSLNELTAVLTGIIIAVIYITPSRAWFEKSHDT